MGNQEFKAKILEKQLASQPKDVVFCKRCVVSNQRPRITFDENGVCNACRFADEKEHSIDWKAREGELASLLDKYRRNDGQWDVLVPGSGGKDSNYVAHQLKHKYGMHPLTVTYAPFIYTDIGFKNLYNFVNAGFNNITAYHNGKIHRKLARAAFEEIGDAFLPFIYGQFCFPFHIALRFGIKLVFYGENGEAEYGGDTSYNHKPGMPIEDWVSRFWKGCNVDMLLAHVLKNKEYIDKSDFDESDLIFYRPPLGEELRKKDIQMHWFSYYRKWVPQENYYYSVEHTGFQPNPKGRSEGTYSKYTSLDDKTDGFHWYMGYIKFGLGRASRDAQMEIRHNHITREEAVELVRKYDHEFPKTYFKDFLSYLDISEEHFWKVVDSFRQPHLWEKVQGSWQLKHQVS